ncbi:MAG: hemolysin family protein [Candidatus Omnitrophota bacterium]
MITEYVLIITLCVLMNAFFAGSEAALTSMNKIRLRHLVEVGDPRAVMISNFVKKSGFFLGTTLVGTNLSVIVGSVFATQLFYAWFGEKAALVSTIVMTPLTLIFGELVPKTVFRQSANGISRIIITPLMFSLRVLYPLIYVVTGITNLVLAPFRGASAKIDHRPFLNRKDIEIMLSMRQPEGFDTPDGRDLIQRIFRLGRVSIGSVMVPIRNAAAMNVNDTVENLKKTAVRTRFSRFPVYENEPSNIVGTVNIYDVLFSDSERPMLREYLKPAFFVGVSDPVDDVLATLRNMKKPMGIVRDGKAVCAGIVTIEDLLEEIVGEIEG